MTRGLSSVAPTIFPPITLLRPLTWKEAISQAFAADAVEHLHRVYNTLLSSEVMTLPLQAFLATFIDRIIAFNRNYPGYLALELGSTISPSLALAIADFQQGVQARLDALLAAYWPQSTPEQRHLPLLVSYRLFLALLPLALSGDEEHRRAIVREMKVVLYRYWEPIMGTQRASEVRSHETHA
jgi:hypothetical protein